jgi:hypothetical protein
MRLPTKGTHYTLYVLVEDQAIFAVVSTSAGNLKICICKIVERSKLGR